MARTFRIAIAAALLLVAGNAAALGLGQIEVKSKREMCEHPRIIDLFQRQIEKLTPNLARYERIKKIALLENEFSIEGGELTPTLKVKRRVIDQKYRDVIEKLYKD